MVGNRMVAVRAGFARLGDNSDKIVEVGVFQHAGEFARRPKFRTGGTDTLDALECVAGGGCWQLTAHGILFNRIHGSDEKLSDEERIVNTFLRSGLIPLGSPFNPRNSDFIRNKKAGHDVRPIADLNDIRSITQTELKNEKRTNNRNSSGNNRTARLTTNPQPARCESATPHPAFSHLLPRAEKKLFCGTFSKRSPITSVNAGLID
jgi:hypothetical protein